jgi:hypothetical protein
MGTSDLKLGLENGIAVDKIDVQLDVDNVEYSSGYRGNAVLRVTNSDINNLQIKDVKRKKAKKSKVDIDIEMDETSEFFEV